MEDEEEGVDELDELDDGAGGCNTKMQKETCVSGEEQCSW